MAALLAATLVGVRGGFERVDHAPLGFVAVTSTVRGAGGLRWRGTLAMAGFRAVARRMPRLASRPIMLATVLAAALLAVASYRRWRRSRLALRGRDPGPHARAALRSGDCRSAGVPDFGC